MRREFARRCNSESCSPSVAFDVGYEGKQVFIYTVQQLPKRGGEQLMRRLDARARVGESERVTFKEPVYSGTKFELRNRIYGIGAVRRVARRGPATRPRVHAP